MLLLLVGSPFFYFFYTLHRDRALDSLSQATTDMSRLVLQTLEQSAFETTPHTLTDVTARVAGARFVQRALIVDKTGRVVLSTDPRSGGQRVSRESPTCRVCHAQAPAARSPATIVTDQRGVEVFRTMRPVYNRPACYGCHPPGDRVNGVVMVDYSTDPVRGRSPGCCPKSAASNQHPLDRLGQRRRLGEGLVEPRPHVAIDEEVHPQEGDEIRQ